MGCEQKTVSSCFPADGFSGCESWCLQLSFPCRNQLLHQFLESFQCALKILYDIRRQYIRLWQVLQICKRLILDPENIKAGLVPIQDFQGGKFPPTAIWVFFRLSRCADGGSLD